MKRRTLLSAGGAAAALGGGVAAGLAAGAWPRPSAAGTTGIPDLPVIDQDGNRYRFYTDLVKGRVVTFNFFFSSCGPTCPLVTQNLLHVQELLGPRVGRDIFMYSITLWPEVDTPEFLRAYADQYGIGRGWRLLTGMPHHIERLRRRLGFARFDPELDRITEDHTGMLRYGNEALDRWGAAPALSRPEWIVKAISTALLEDAVA